jgi:hypothetical protein
LRRRHQLALLRHGLAQLGEEGLEIAHADHVGAGAAACGEAASVFAAVFLQRREFLLHFDQVRFSGTHPFCAFALGARRNLLDDI